LLKITCSGEYAFRKTKINKNVKEMHNFMES
jgi:hypothetical protein